MDVNSEGAGEAHYAKGVCVPVSVTSPDSRKFRIERGEVVLQANSREERVKVRRIGCATSPHQFRDGAGSRIYKLHRVDQEEARIRGSMCSFLERLLDPVHVQVAEANP